MSEIQIKHGIVGFFDVLGVSDLSITQTVEFIEFINKTNERMHKAIDLEFSLSEDHLPSHVIKKFKYPVIKMFGDSILLAWELDNDLLDIYYGKLIVFPVIGNLSRWLISNGYSSHNVYFRGACGIGKYATDGNIILGPVVSQCVKLEGNQEWFGVVLTEELGNIFEQYSLEATKRTSGKYRTEEIFVRYAVPLKNPLKGNKDNLLYCSSWPHKQLMYQKEQEDKDSKIYKNTIANMIFSKIDYSKLKDDVKIKYQNSEKFFHWYEQNIYELFPHNYREGLVKAEF